MAIDLRDELRAARRDRLLCYLASAIHGFTISGRNPEQGAAAGARINNLIHYLAGHLTALTDAEEPLAESRIDGIVELSGWLEPGLAAQVRAVLSP
jgi:hypothetical protein